MNLPNKLTIFRIALVPFVVLFLMYSEEGYRYLYAFLLFIIASYTDRLDGYIARKKGIITNFGKIMDPLADKILVTSLFICFSSMGLVPPLATILIVSREFIVTSIRFLILECENKVISANIWGKLKTVSQMVTIMFVLILQIYISFSKIYFTVKFIDLYSVIFIQNILVWISVVLSVVSGVVYILKNSKYIKTN